MPTVTPIEGLTLGAVVTDVDLGHLDEPAWKALEAAFLEHAVLIFPGQHPSSEVQVAFAKRFGEIEHLTPNPELEAVPLSNVRADGSFIGEEEHITRVLRGNEGWHTDSSYKAVPSKGSVLTARIVPTEGGETEFAEMRAAYDALAPAMRTYLADKRAVHSYA